MITIDKLTTDFLIQIQRIRNYDTIIDKIAEYTDTHLSTIDHNDYAMIDCIKEYCDYVDEEFPEVFAIPEDKSFRSTIKEIAYLCLSTYLIHVVEDDYIYKHYGLVYQYDF